MYNDIRVIRDKTERKRLKETRRTFTVLAVDIPIPSRYERERKVRY